MDLKELMDIYRKEKLSPYLQDLGEDFYSEVAAVLRELESEYELGGSGNKKRGVHLRELENVTSIVNDLYEIRERKVVLSALNYVRREDEEIELENLTDTEEKMLEDVAAILKDNRKEVLEGDVPKKAKKSPKKKQAKKKETKKEPDMSLVTIRITKDLPSIVGADGKVYGEFTEEDVVSLPDANAKALIEQGAAEEIKL